MQGMHHQTDDKIFRLVKNLEINICDAAKVSIIIEGYRDHNISQQVEQTLYSRRKLLTVISVLHTLVQL